MSISAESSSPNKAAFYGIVYILLHFLFCLFFDAWEYLCISAGKK